LLIVLVAGRCWYRRGQKTIDHVLDTLDPFAPSVPTLVRVVYVDYRYFRPRRWADGCTRTAARGLAH
jgi:hypothetical protein